ncbi:MAG: DUF1446 domain-containing protein [Chloroflexi bacterium]|nr:DUF1446 domain-containing protein [Chloroflexota bacterium]
MSRSVRALAATGQVGTGFAEQSLRTGAEGADFIGSDAGSTDQGPYYLGSGETQASDAAVRRDLGLMLASGIAAGIPVLVGTAGTAGGRPHLERTVRIARELARDHGWHFKLATIDTELDKDFLVEALRAGRITALDPAPVFDEEVIQKAERIVGMMGAEPFQRALRVGAQVVIAGRSTDTSIFAAYPIQHGIPTGIAWHAGKILECGTAAVEQRLHPDSLVADMDQAGFTVWPPHPGMWCTPASVVSHTLYENADPYHLIEPGGMLDSTACAYEAVNERAVRVTGSRFVPSSDYTVKLEGAILVGYRSVAIGGVRDPLVIRQLDSYLAGAQASISHKVRDSLGLEPGAYTLKMRVYGHAASMGALEPQPRATGHEVGVLIDVIAETQLTAHAIITIAWHTTLHHPLPEYSGLVSNLAFPYSPPGIDAGPAYRFCSNHVLHLDDPCGPFKMTIEDL